MSAKCVCLGWRHRGEGGCKLGIIRHFPSLHQQFLQVKAAVSRVIKSASRCSWYTGRPKLHHQRHTTTPGYVCKHLPRKPCQICSWAVKCPIIPQEFTVMAREGQGHRFLSVKPLVVMADRAAWSSSPFLAALDQRRGLEGLRLGG